MDLALNNQQRLICHKTQPTNQKCDFFYLGFWYSEPPDPVWLLYIPGLEHFQ